MYSFKLCTCYLRENKEAYLQPTNDLYSYPCIIYAIYSYD